MRFETGDGFEKPITNPVSTTFQRQCTKYSRFLFAVTLVFLSIARLTFAADGDLDPSFGTAGRQMVQIAADEREYVNTIVVQPDGKILLGGEIGDYFADYNRAVLVRLNPDGTIDQSFGNGGIVINNGQIHLKAMVLQSDGKILTAATTSILGDNFDFTLVRYNSDGTLDQTYGNGGYANNGSGHAEWLMLQPDGRAVAVGFLPIFRNGSDYLLARFNQDGSIDQAFGISGRVQTSFTSGRNSGDNALAGALQSDGKIVLTGFAGGFSPVLIRFNANGSIDSSFGSGGTVFTPSFGAIASRIFIQPDGKIIVCGGGFVIGRYNPDGSTDQTFGSNGRVAGGFGTGHGNATGMVLQADGKLLVGGSVSYTGTGNSAFIVGRYKTDGSLDQTFGSGGFVITEFTGALDEAFAIALQSNGRILAAGYAAEPGATYVDFAVARYLGQTNKIQPRSALGD
jgi:uncharacterized delta-60 repeat protein